MLVMTKFPGTYGLEAHIENYLRIMRVREMYLYFYSYICSYVQAVTS